MVKPTGSLIGLLVFYGMICVQNQSHAQTYNIGNSQVTYTDPERNNRPIPVELFYPATTAGFNVPLAEGEFPIIAFGHGFIMAYSAYQYLWEALVPEGYIMAFPTTEGSAIPAPDHLDFGLDLRFVIEKMRMEGVDPGSAFFGHIADSAAIMGHSMGGGASFLAAVDQIDISAMITFAAAETNPSAISAAAGISVPTLVFSGSDDCVAPPDQHQLPMYNNLGSSCRTFISITGGGHCYFADYNFNCSLGELFCNPAASITRQEQHDIVLDHLIPYLDFMLKGNIDSWVAFNQLLNNPSGITVQHQSAIGYYNIKALMEGPFDGIVMSNALNTIGLLPLSQPYQMAPWNYPGSEAVNSIPNSDVVDWILLEWRDASDAFYANSTTITGHKAAFLLKDGSIVDLDGVSPLRFDAFYQNMPFIVIYHRNHLPVMSAISPGFVDGIYNYDFTINATQAYGTEAQKLLPGGKFGLYAGDFNADGMISDADKNENWYFQAGIAGYLSTDANFDGEADNLDKNDQWMKNVGESNQVPQ